jgi:hypothetical protein
MRNLIRNPLTWMVIAEIVVVTALIVLAWNALASVSRPGLASPLGSSSGAPAATASPLPDLPSITRPASTAPLPGLNVDPVFWLSRLQALNRDQVFFERLEWRLVHSATDAAQRYLETVVLPSVERAERPAGPDL